MLYQPVLFVVVMVGVAVLAGVGNRILFRWSPRRAPFLFIPWWEEGCKLTAALLFPGVLLLLVHVVFGLFELSYNLWRNQTDRLFFGMLGLCIHGLVGGAAQLVYRNNELGWAYVAAVVAHMGLNLFVVRLVLPSMGAAPGFSDGRT